MGTGISELTLTQLAALGKYSNVIFFNDPSDTDLLKTIVGSPRTILINLGQFLNIAAGEIQGDAIADELSTDQIAAGALAASSDGREIMATDYFDVATLLDKIAVDAFTEANVDALFAAGAIDGIDRLKAASVGDDRLVSSVVKDPGALATGFLRVSGNTADGETITIGSDVFEIDPIVADSSDDTAGSSWNNVDDPLTVDLIVGTYPNLQGALIVGELIYIGTEYMRVTAIGGGAGDEVTFERGAGGSTPATHADAQNIFISAATPAATNIPVGVQADFTPSVVGPILVDTINEDAGASGQANAVSAVDLKGDGTVIFIVADAVGAVVLATTDTHGNGAWDTTAMRRGAVAAVRQIYRTAVVPDSEEVTANEINVPLPFTPTSVIVQVKVTSTGVNKLWVGDTIIVAASPPMPAYVTINNDGATDFDGSDTISIIAIE